LNILTHRFITVPGYPKVQCERVECPAPYTNHKGYVQPNAPPDVTLPAQDPFGLGARLIACYYFLSSDLYSFLPGGESYVSYGTCPRDAPFPNDTEVMRTLSYAKLNAFDYSTHGQFFWNFRTEFEPRWDYQQAVALGWLPTHWSSAATQREIASTCEAIQLDAQSTSNSGDKEEGMPTDPPGNNTISSLRSMSRSFAALAIAVGIVVGMYCGLTFCFRRYPGWSERNVYTSISSGNKKDSDGYEGARDVELCTTSNSSDRPQVMFPTHGGSTHISPYQEAIILNH
jgi:hypothetical protein